MTFSKSVIVLALIFSSSAFSNLEHIEGQGSSPLKIKLNHSRGCFQDMAELGCGHPRDGHDSFVTCLNEKRTHLSSTCEAFFERLYGKQKG
jgi:hypothetical protein